MKKIYSLLLLTFVTISAQAQVVISQVYGGGGNAGATYTHDFVELYNKGAASVDISGWSIQYAPAATGTWAVNAIPAASTIGAGKYFLVKLASQAAVGIALPTPDADITTSPINMAGANGKVALVNNTTALSGTVVTTGYVDLLGFGTASSFETAAFPTTGTNNTLAFHRGNNGCTDTDNNSTDFALASVNPRNSTVAAYSCTAPSLSVTSPSTGLTYSPETTSMSLTLGVNNFNVANGTGNGHIHYTVNSGSVVMKYDTTPISLTSLTPGLYTVYLELVDNSHVAIVPAVNTTFTFTIASYTVAADLAAVRADVVANGANKYYQVTSNPVITYARASRNQKYIQDATGGILIDDVAGTITTPMVAGDAIGGLKGQATLFSSLLQFIPSTNATVISSGNVVTPQVVTIADINAATTAATYESELVQINNVTFDLTSPNFPTTATTFNINTGADVILFRTLFTEANYMNTPKPVAATNIYAIVGRSAAVPHVTSRNTADLNVVLGSASFSQIDGLKMYPNPTKNNLFIETALNSNINVSIINMLGKEVVNANVVNNTVNVANLTSGLYIVKITEEGKTSTKKLIIE
ncbi:T9SS type A sorting domain-containing protein [Flavobacterium sp. F372]|uniref:T9SS type A sorting domain-containing protein n=1 Tax=Flavobacterium bernardetii TaxID=2813823 RepID=A0ABR7IZW3_9FLAO|nr:T9SS type A sorting domain-containing protein [Flavobacterium bernardetii]MBC5835144.1 T9SS type A sorting domain-containing protein [Flavobacterium bernardetii]NHF70740.1 T9SS type A sorting domain-containing protein [Flavobacterium bernardetii]